MNLFGLQDLLLGATVDRDEPGMQGISLAGVQGSPEFTASREWLEFTANYDQDGALLAQVGNAPAGLDTRFDLYHVYTQDMANKLDEIVTRHNLRLHREIDMLEQEEQLNIRLGGVLLPNGYEMLGGYIYEDNSFHFDGYASLPSGRGFSFQLMCARKGSFNEVMLNIGNAALYDHWTFIPPYSVPMLLALGPDKSLVVADTGAAFVTINVLTGSGQGDAEHFFEGEDFITREELEAFAQGFNFEILRH
jgi:hypothetical protein